MSNIVEQRLSSLGIILPEASASVANYVPYQFASDLVFISGQLPLKDGVIVNKGQVGIDVVVEEAVQAAHQCAINLLAQIKAACNGDLDRVEQLIRLGGFVNACPGFEDHALVINGASNLMSEIFQDRGKHARAAVGCSSLPFGAAVEVEALVRIRA